MKNIIALVAISMVIAFGAVYAKEKAPASVVEFAHSTLVKMGSDPVIVKAVKAENAKGKTLDQIKSMDKKWKATPGVADYMDALMTSECGGHLRQIQKREAYYAKIFVMDNLGANVCMTDKTSDYWQGDEAKFIKSYKGGEGALHIGPVKFDDSTQAYLVQVSVPVKDGDKVIGAITIGIDVDKLS